MIPTSTFLDPTFEALSSNQQITLPHYIYQGISKSDTMIENVFWCFQDSIEIEQLGEHFSFVLEGEESPEFTSIG